MLKLYPSSSIACDSRFLHHRHVTPRGIDGLRVDVVLFGDVVRGMPEKALDLAGLARGRVRVSSCARTAERCGGMARLKALSVSLKCGRGSNAPPSVYQLPKHSASWSRSCRPRPSAGPGDDGRDSLFEGPLQVRWQPRLDRPLALHLAPIPQGSRYCLPGARVRQCAVRRSSRGDAGGGEDGRVGRRGNGRRGSGRYSRMDMIFKADGWAAPGVCWAHRF